MLTIDEIQNAQKSISKHIKTTPLEYSYFLSHHSGFDCYLKLENLQRTGSYKFRGALNKIMTLTKDQLKKGIVASSAGNHAQGVALAAKLLGTKATIIMPEMTPLSKVQGTESLGAEVILHGSIYDEAYEKALELEKELGMYFVHPFNDPLIMAGQGTIGLELLNDLPDLDAVIVPVGGGGLISGIACCLKALKPEIDIIGVEAEKMAAMKESLDAHKRVIVKKEKTMADGIAVAQVGNLTFNQVNENVKKVITVSEDELAKSVMTLLEREKLLVEGAGAAAYASILSKKLPELKNKKVAVIISGGNIDITFLEKIIKRGLVDDGRLTHLSLIVPDSPGTISKITKVIGNNGANILDIHHDRTFTNAHLGETDIELGLETKGHEHIKQLTKELKSQGFKIIRKDCQ